MVSNESSLLCEYLKEIWQPLFYSRTEYFSEDHALNKYNEQPWKVQVEKDPRLLNVLQERVLRVKVFHFRLLNENVSKHGFNELISLL